MARTPSSSAHEKVLRAAVELVANRGVDGTSMDEVARQSGVSKATIYKHWADKEALVMEMLAWVSGLHDRPNLKDCDTRAGLIAALTHRPKDNAEWKERVTPHIVSYGAAHPAFGYAWRQMVMEPPRRELRELIETGIRKGELTADVDMDIAVAILLGPLLYWHIFRKEQKETADLAPFVEAVVASFWAAHKRNKKARPS